MWGFDMFFLKDHPVCYVENRLSGGKDSSIGADAIIQVRNERLGAGE